MVTPTNSAQKSHPGNKADGKDKFHDVEGTEAKSLGTPRKPRKCVSSAMNFFKPDVKSHVG